jgi:diguanylate cyclase (GGDEF)-like protein
LVETNIVNLEKKRRSERRNIRFITFIIILLVTAAIGFSLWFDYQNTVATVNGDVLLKVRATNNADFVYEGFISDLGELFVVSSRVPPNPNLPKDKQEIVSRDGTRLIRLNPTYVTRLVHALEVNSEGMARKIVSTEPTDMIDSADEWEAAAIKDIENRKIDEKFEILKNEAGQDIVRYLSPFIIRESCTSCHTGLKAGERYGGISVSLSYAPYLNTIKRTVIPIAGAHIAIWLLMLLILIAFSNSIVTQLKKKNMAEDVLLDTTAELNKEIEICNEFENELRESRKRFQELAQKDPLTNLYNRRRFFEVAATEIKRMQRIGGVASLAMLDIDHFKRFNDTYGHIAGDNCLKTISAKIREIIREIDVVARYGGEEFVFLFPQTPGDYAFSVAERLRNGLSSAPIKLEDDRIVFVTVSIGFTEIDPESIKELNHEEVIHAAIRDADIALYNAKITRNATIDFRTIAEAEAAINNALAEAEQQSVEFKDPTNSKGAVDAPKYAEDLQKVTAQKAAPSINSLLTDFSPASKSESAGYTPVSPQEAYAEDTYTETAAEAPFEEPAAPKSLAEEYTPAEEPIIPEEPSVEEVSVEEPPVEEPVFEEEVEAVETAEVSEEYLFPEELDIEEPAALEAPEEPSAIEEPSALEDTSTIEPPAEEVVEQTPLPPIEPVSPEGFLLDEDEPFNKKV